MIILLLAAPLVMAVANQVGMSEQEWGLATEFVVMSLPVLLIGWVWSFGVRHQNGKPITFFCEATLDQPPEEISRQILDVENWSGFGGYGPLPGIKEATFETRTPEIVGSRIRVTNADGSSHVEEIVEWNPETTIELRMGEFSPPLSRLATEFHERWEFDYNGTTQVVRSFELHPKSAWTRPALWCIAFFLKKAIARHLRQMATR